jgi:type IV/VI secretion system ImpK/VasF family protein
MSSLTQAYPPPSQGSRRQDNLAFLFQELFTVIARLRANRQPVRDPSDFRAQIAATLTTASKDAVNRGYQQEDVKYAAYAVVALLDESILGSGNPAFADWLRNPLQAQLFGVLLAGEKYFSNIDTLLSRPDSQDLADVLEVYLLGLSLGFRGRHGRERESPASGSGRAMLRNVTEMIRDKIRRTRGSDRPLHGDLNTSPQAAVSRRDTMRSRLAWLAVIVWIVALLAFVGFKIKLVGMPADIPQSSITIRN